MNGAPVSRSRQRARVPLVASRVARLDWSAISRSLDDLGSSLTGRVLRPEECSAIAQGEGLVFTTRDRPVPSRRGWSAAPMRHGVSVLRSGQRRALALVFHEAR